MAAAGRNREGDREIMALTARELEMRQLQRQREQNAWNKETRIQRMENEIADGSARHGIYAIKQQKEAVDYLRGGGISGLRAHELDMLEKQNKGALDVQKEKTRTAGEGARQTGLTNIELEKLRGGYTDNEGVFHPGSQTLLEREKMQNGLTLAEKQIASQERIAGMEHGTIGEDGTVTPGSRERVTRITKEAEAQQAEKERQFQLEKQKLVNEGTAAVATTRGEASVAAAQARGDQAQANRIKRFNEMAAQDKFMTAGITADKWLKMSEEEKARVRNQILNSMDELNANPQPPKKKSLSDYEVK